MTIHCALSCVHTEHMAHWVHCPACKGVIVRVPLAVNWYILNTLPMFVYNIQYVVCYLCVCVCVGVLDCQFHPTQPWLFTAGADSTIRLFTWHSLLCCYRQWHTHMRKALCLAVMYLECLQTHEILIYCQLCVMYYFNTAVPPNTCSCMCALRTVMPFYYGYLWAGQFNLGLARGFW